jgi:hypothetical protein
MEKERLSCYECAYLKMSGGRFVDDALCMNPCVQVVMFMESDHGTLNREKLSAGCTFASRERTKEPKWPEKAWETLWKNRERDAWLRKADKAPAKEAPRAADVPMEIQMDLF